MQILEREKERVGGKDERRVRGMHVCMKMTICPLSCLFFSPFFSILLSLSLLSDVPSWRERCATAGTLRAWMLLA